MGPLQHCSIRLRPGKRGSAAAAPTTLACTLVLCFADLVFGFGRGPGSVAEANAGWPRPRLCYETASTHVSPFVDFLSFREGVPTEGIPDRAEPLLLEAEDPGLNGFSVGFSLHPDLDFAWTRLSGASKLRYYVAGNERFDEQLTDGVITRLPRFAFTFDVFSARWAPARLRWRDRVGPVVGLGWGSVDQEQQGLLNLAGRNLEWGAKDTVVEMMIGGEIRVPWARAGVDLRLNRWRFEPDSDTIPAETVYARMWVGWVRLAF